MLSGSRNEPGAQLAELIAWVGLVADEAEDQPATWLTEAHVPHPSVLGGEVVGLAQAENLAVDVAALLRSR